MPNKLLKSERVAEILDVPKDHVTKLAKLGLMPAIRVGRAWRFDSVKLQDWMERGGAGGWKRAEFNSRVHEDFTLGADARQSTYLRYS